MSNDICLGDSDKRDAGQSSRDAHEEASTEASNYLDKCTDPDNLFWASKLPEISKVAIKD